MEQVGTYKTNAVFNPKVRGSLRLYSGMPFAVISRRSSRFYTRLRQICLRPARNTLKQVLSECHDQTENTELSKGIEMPENRSLKSLYVYAAIILFLTTLSSSLSAQLPEPKKQAESDTSQPTVSTELLMRAKLANSQRVLEGLVTEDFQLIRDGAKRMKKIAEAAHWPKAIDEVYQHHSYEFRRQCDKLAGHADRNDLQAAHFTYLSMSTTCIDCHNYVRRKFRVERKKHGPIKLIPTEWDGPTKKNEIQPPQPDDDKGANEAPATGPTRIWR